MKRMAALVACLLLVCVLLVVTTGCGGSEEQEQPTEIDGKVKVPDVTGLSEDEAREKIKASNLDCSVKEINVTDVDKEGKVLSQDPQAGTMLTPDMTVYLEVGDF